MTTATMTRPLYETDKPLHERLVEIMCDSKLQHGFRWSAHQVLWEDREIQRPADLSTEAIRTALLDSIEAEQESGKSLSWPLFAFLRTNRNGCRSWRWCRGDCDRNSTGERLHISSATTFLEREFGDWLSIEITQYEGSDGAADEPKVWLGYASEDDTVPTDDCLMSPTQARKLGETLYAEIDPNKPGKAGVIADMQINENYRVIVERKRERARLDGSKRGSGYEFTILSQFTDEPMQIILDRYKARSVARMLIVSANHADGLDVEVPF
jgi:hypothetical protein